MLQVISIGVAGYTHTINTLQRHSTWNKCAVFYLNKTQGLGENKMNCFQIMGNYRIPGHAWQYLHDGNTSKRGRTKYRTGPNWTCGLQSAKSRNVSSKHYTHTHTHTKLTSCPTRKLRICSQFKIHADFLLKNPVFGKSVAKSFIETAEYE